MITDKSFDTIKYSVRAAASKDLEAMREICIKTSSVPLKTEADMRYLLLMYCDSYLEYADCFVAVDGDDKPIGYILCSPDTREFCRVFIKNVLPEIKKLGFKYSAMARGIIAQQKLCAPLAPAHLHIDLTESARRQGIGTALIKTLKEHLSAQGIDRVQLTCGSKNTAAISFYKHNGFKTVVRGFGACVMRAETK